MPAESRATYLLRGIRFLEDVDEPNDSFQTATPLAADGAWRFDRTLYSTAGGAVPAPGTGDEDWYRIDAVIGSRLRVVTRYPGAAKDADTQCDTHLSVWSPSGGQVTSTDKGGAGRNALVRGVTISESGVWRVRVQSVDPVRTYGRYDLRALWEFENLRPRVIEGPTADPDLYFQAERTTLSVVAQDDQPLTYQWEPLDGGSILGSGPVVEFLRNGNRLQREFRVSLVIRDALGAETGPLIVTVRARPQLKNLPR